MRLVDDDASEQDRGIADPRVIFATLDRHGVDYVTIGGVALIAHGHTRNTRDVDLVAADDSANLERLAAALSELRAELWGVDARLLDIDVYDPATLASRANFTLQSSAGGLDLYFNVPGGAPYDQLRARSIAVDVDGVRVRVAGEDDLIRMKRAAGRDRDLADIAALTEIRGPR